MGRRKIREGHTKNGITEGLGFPQDKASCHPTAVSGHFCPFPTASPRFGQNEGACALLSRALQSDAVVLGTAQGSASSSIHPPIFMLLPSGSILLMVLPCPHSALRRISLALPCWGTKPSFIPILSSHSVHRMTQQEPRSSTRWELCTQHLVLMAPGGIQALHTSTLHKFQLHCCDGKEILFFLGGYGMVLQRHAGEHSRMLSKAQLYGAASPSLRFLKAVGTAVG